MWHKTAVLQLGRRWFSVPYNSKFHSVRTSLLWCVPCRNDRLVCEQREHILVVYYVEICPLALTEQLCSGCTAAQLTGRVMNGRRWGNNCYLCTFLPMHCVVANTSDWGPKQLCSPHPTEMISRLWERGRKDLLPPDPLGLFTREWSSA